MSNKSYRVRFVEVEPQSPPAYPYEIYIDEVSELAQPGSPPEEEVAALKEKKELWKFEYERAQEMMQHYDSLSWNIGSIFIAGITVLTGLALGKDGFELLTKGWRSLVAVAGIPSVSFLILLFWGFWFRRHRALYRLRDDVLHRLERQLGMYHFLRVAEANMIDGYLRKAKVAGQKLPDAIEKAGKALTIEQVIKDLCSDQKVELGVCDKARALSEKKKEVFGVPPHEPISTIEYTGPSSYKLVWRLVALIPLVQFTILFLLWWSNMLDRLNETYAGRPWAAWDTMYHGMWKGWVWWSPLLLLLVWGVSVIVLRRKTREL